MSIGVLSHRGVERAVRVSKVERRNQRHTFEAVFSYKLSVDKIAHSTGVKEEGDWDTLIMHFEFCR